MRQSYHLSFVSGLQQYLICAMLFKTVWFGEYLSIAYFKHSSFVMFYKYNADYCYNLKKKYIFSLIVIRMDIYTKPLEKIRIKVPAQLEITNIVLKSESE